MNRANFQQLADIRVQEADVLLANKRFEGAYYLLGYAIECALKACIAKQIRQDDFPDKKFIVESYTHALTKLLSLSGLKVEHDREAARSRAFAENWTIVKDWSEESRYSVRTPAKKAQDLYSAIQDGNDGVLQWLKKWW